MTKKNYPTFLEDKRVYNLVRASWKRSLDRMLGDNQIEYRPYLNPYQNGKLEYDGNPIYNAFFPSLNKAIRIIQVADEGESQVDCSAWIDRIKPEESKEPFNELVIDIVLSKVSRKMAEQLIKHWILGDYSADDMEKAIKQIIQLDI